MAQLVKTKGNTEPELMSVFYKEKKPVYASININIVKIDDEEYSYSWDELILPDFALENIYNAPKNIKYDVLVAHIIKAYYDDNKMAAVLNNYLADMEDPEHKAEFLTMQNVRKIAKYTAQRIITERLF